MKRGFFLSAAFILSCHLFAQNFQSGQEKYDHQPRAFSQVNGKAPVNKSFFDAVLTMNNNQDLDIPVSDHLLLKGKVKAVRQEQSHVKSAVIDITGSQGMTLCISRVILPDNTIQYVGMIQSKKFSDMLMLEKDVNGDYAWVKKDLSSVLPD